MLYFIEGENLKITYDDYGGGEEEPFILINRKEEFSKTIESLGFFFLSEDIRKELLIKLQKRANRISLGDLFVIGEYYWLTDSNTSVLARYHRDPRQKNSDKVGFSFIKDNTYCFVEYLDLDDNITVTKSLFGNVSEFVKRGSKNIIGKSNVE